MYYLLLILAIPGAAVWWLIFIGLLQQWYS